SSPLPERLTRLILDKAEGNPFFLEEMSRAVAEQGGLRASLAVPDTIQELLQARIDRLPVESRRLLQTASLLRREFSPELLEAFSLTALGRVQEVLDLLLPHQERVDRQGDRALAGRYYFLVGRTYSFLGQYERAAQNARRAIAEATQCGDEATMGKAYSLLAIQSVLSGEAHAGLEHGRQAIALLERTAERWWLGHAYWMVGLNYCQMGEFEPALQAEGRAHAI